MTLPSLKVFLLPMLAIVLINAVAGLLRTLPDAVGSSEATEAWPEFQLPASALDINAKLLSGGQWGQPELITNADAENTGESSALEDESVVREYVQRQLQGIVYRNGWHLLFAQEEGLPLELQEGDSLPDSPWAVGRIFPDRIELLDGRDESTPLNIFLYPIPDASTEL